MNPFPRLFPERTRRPRHCTALLAAVAVAAGALAACGSSGSAGSGQRGAPSSIRVVATVERGDITQSVSGSVTFKVSGREMVAVATIAQADASSVAKGQTASVMAFPKGMNGTPYPRPNASSSGYPQAGQSGMPQPQGSMVPGPQASQGGMPFGGQSGQPGFGGRGASGTVTAVKTAADGTATATISLSKTPDGVKNGSGGAAFIETQVLASNVLVIPTAAIEGSGGSATVQVLSGGKTTTRSIVVGQQANGQSEVTSGLSEGETIVYMRSFSFPRGVTPGPGGSGMPQPGAGGMPPGGQPAAPPNGTSSGGFQ